MGKWEEKKLSEICEIVGGGTPKTKIPSYWGNDFVWLSPTDLPEIGNIVGVDNSRKKITQLGLEKSSAKLLPKGTVLFSSRATIGKIGIAKINLATNQGFTNFICKEKVYNIFLAYALKRYTNEITELSNSTTFKEVSKSSIKNFKIPVPPLREQKRIVSKLDGLFEKIDQAIKLLEENIEHTEALMGSVLDEEFGSSNHKSKQIKDLVLKTETLSPKVVFGKDEFTYIDISSINKDIHKIESPKILSGLVAPSRARKVIKIDDIVFATTRPNLKNIALVSKEYKNPIASTGFCVLRVNEELLINEYLFYFLISDKVQDLIQPFIRGAQYPAISDKDLKSIKIPILSLEVQKKKIKKIKRVFDNSNNLLKAQYKKLNHLKALKSSLLDQAFKGEL